MNPLPVQLPAIELPDLSAASPPPVQAAPYSKSNRRIGYCPSQRAYPWLLGASTALAAIFCTMYVTKPVIVAPGLEEDSLAIVPDKSSSDSAEVTAPRALLPDQHRLPGEKPVVLAAGNGVALPAPTTGQFEQTNLRVQHILSAETPDGQLAKIDIDVPVLYQSRQLRWTPGEVADARGLLDRLAAYQEKSKSLRDEGAELLDAWNQLVSRSIPVSDLRADSPTLPANQEISSASPRPTGFDTAESIQIQPATK